VTTVDVCIIGAGAAGLTIARELAGSRLSVCVVESGDHGQPPARDPVYDLRYSRLRVSHDSRVRGFGGTTKVWAGRWKRFDPIDFDHRRWVPHARWPISYASLEPYYERAAAALGIDEDFGYAVRGPDILRSSVVMPSVFHTQALEQRDWGATWGRSLLRVPNVEVLLGAHVVGLERRGRSVVRVSCRRVDGTQMSISARFVVLGAGGIENARLLLISKLGNEHDQVGRYYMDHPRANIGVVETYESVDYEYVTRAAEGAPRYLGYRLADEVQRDEQVLNSHVFLAAAVERDMARRLVRIVRRPAKCRLLVVRHYLEQVPDPENRVFLIDEPDPFGLPKAVVAWSIGALDRRTIVVFHRYLQRELQRAGIGELHSPLLHHPEQFPDVHDASHPMGTTRMGDDPITSVVDAHCRVHSLDNVFVAGSSVFPVSGHANPTATIVALAIRLSDHLQQVA
jgi:choline dehydrogenase-like flavoprotein